MQIATHVRFRFNDTVVSADDSLRKAVRYTLANQQSVQVKNHIFSLCLSHVLRSAHIRRLSCDSKWHGNDTGHLGLSKSRRSELKRAPIDAEQRPREEHENGAQHDDIFPKVERRRRELHAHQRVAVFKLQRRGGRIDHHWPLEERSRRRPSLSTFQETRNC
eukprot:4729044-Pleurochrysis_carterae.AAC.10